jgi:gas vesicle protein
MDLSCNEHGNQKKGKGGHWGAPKATPLEHVVINSFTDINPRELTGSNEFVGWTENELHFACYGTDSLGETSKRMFDDKQMYEKLKTYVSTFEGAAEMFRKSEELMRSEEDVPSAIMTCVREWSGAMNPLIFLWCMKARNERMVGKIVRLKNTVDIWKEEAEKAKRETAQLKWKLKFLKKTTGTK